MSHRSGDVLGRYQLLCPIAAGGMATVWAARVRGAGTFQKPVALKLMLQHLARDERFVKMFMDEAMLAANIQSPHVVGTYDLGHDEETLYMSMELVLGMTLRDLSTTLGESGETFPLDVALAISLAMARGLTDAHEAKGATGEPLGIIHRDVSPHNVLLGLDGRARLSDFGIARAVQRQSRTATGEVKGKLSYFAPEQLKGDELDQRVDVFALGIVIWETLAGKRLFAAENPLQLANQIANDAIPRIDAVRTDVPVAVADALERALVRDRENRWQTARAFASALAKATPSVAPETEIAAFFRAHAGTKVEALEKRVRELMALPTDAPADSFRSGQTGKVALTAPTPSALESKKMPGLPVEAKPPASFPPPAPLRPHYARIAVVALVAIALLAGTAWGAMHLFGSSAPPPSVVADESIGAGPAPPPSVAEAPPVSALVVPTTTVGDAIPVATTVAAPPPSAVRRDGRRTRPSSRGEPPPSTPVVATTAARDAPPPTRAGEPATTGAPARRSIVADQDEFCRAMGTCP